MPAISLAIPADPRVRLRDSAMSPYQWRAVLLTVAICALDGFDVLAITLAAPGIVHAWDVAPSALGLVFSIGLAGMAAGSLIVAPLADILGRRPLVLAGVLLMAAGSAFCAAAQGVADLALWRFVTGVGIGATIAVINPLAVEYANLRRHDLCVALMAAGFPIGGVLGGWASAFLLSVYDWRAVFILGAGSGFLMLGVAALVLPESIEFMIERPRPHSLRRVNAFLVRCAHRPVQTLPAPRERDRASLLAIFRGDRLAETLQVTAIYFLFVMTVYFFLSWIPQMVAAAGHPPAAAAGVSATANMAGVAGGLLLGWATERLGLKPLVVGALSGMGLATMAFGFASTDLALLTASAAVAGFFLFAGMVGLYAVVARTFPPAVRATGTGFVIGVGRIGSALAPAIAGFLFSAGMGRGLVSIGMGALALAAAALLIRYRLGSGSRHVTANSAPATLDEQTRS